jgi:hypothetical protein
MQDKHSQRKQSLPLQERAGFSPSEFAQQFGKEKVWAYRQIYAGRLKCIKGFGRTIIPRTELDRILSEAK